MSHWRDDHRTFYPMPGPLIVGASGARSLHWAGAKTLTRDHATCLLAVCSLDGVSGSFLFGHYFRERSEVMGKDRRKGDGVGRFAGRAFWRDLSDIIGSAEALPILCVSDFCERERERERERRL